MISSMDLFFSRDCAEGGGPTVELPRPLLAASPEAAVVEPAVGAGAVVVAPDGWLVPPVGLLNSVDAGGPPDAGAELAGLLPPPRLNSDVPVVEVVVAPAPAVVVGAAEAAFVDAAVAPPAVGKLNPPELPAPEAFGPVFADENMLLGASVLEAGGLSAPGVEAFVELLTGCAEVPRLKVGGLLAGVAEGVVLPRLPNKDVFVVAGVP